MSSVSGHWRMTTCFWGGGSGLMEIGPGSHKWNTPLDLSNVTQCSISQAQTDHMLNWHRECPHGQEASPQWLGNSSSSHTWHQWLVLIFLREGKAYQCSIIRQCYSMWYIYNIVFPETVQTPLPLPFPAPNSSGWGGINLFVCLFFFCGGMFLKRNPSVMLKFPLLHIQNHIQISVTDNLSTFSMFDSNQIDVSRDFILFCHSYS